ncbi:MAG: hypothetical protein CH6_0223 [Candidatus Kapaibacterium sp.]|nr:MAG: hypothetical protein CH6_0223 [Candidatus Kapabacteria bacterium]
MVLVIRRLTIILLLITPAVIFSQNQKCVWICKGPMSYAYHSTPNCKGLKNCSTDIYEVTLEEAKELNRRPCRFCGGNPFDCKPVTGERPKQPKKPKKPRKASFSEKVMSNTFFEFQGAYKPFKGVNFEDK